MEQLVERLSGKLLSLSTSQLGEVEQFVESLQVTEHERDMTGVLSRSSEPAFEAVWSNAEDEAYDAL